MVHSLLLPLQPLILSAQLLVGMLLGRCSVFDKGELADKEEHQQLHERWCCIEDGEECNQGVKVPVLQEHQCTDHQF